MSVQRGNNLNYSGMNLDLKTKGQVVITIPHQANNVIKELPGKLRNLTQTSPNSSKLFEVGKAANDLGP